MINYPIHLLYLYINIIVKGEFLIKLNTKLLYRFYYLYFLITIVDYRRLAIIYIMSREVYDFYLF